MTVASATITCDFCGDSQEFPDMARQPVTYAQGVIQLAGPFVQGGQRQLSVNACPACANKDPLLPHMQPAPRLAIAGEMPSNVPDFAALKNGRTP